MIYISTSCIKNNKKIKTSVEELAINGFSNIELSGGTEPYDQMEYDLLELKDKYNLNYRCHNYFPPPIEPFVLNLASVDEDVYLKTIANLKKSIRLSQKLGATKFAFHAGFFLNISLNEIGKKLTRTSLFDKKVAIELFCERFNELQLFAGKLDLYIENNVYSSSNYNSYDGQTVFMLCNYKDYIDLKQKIAFNLLLDVAHLKVSARTLSLNFESELVNMLKESDYIHISDNDGLHDLNNCLSVNSDLTNLLKQHDLKKKDFTIEVYESMASIKESHDLLREVIQ
jgi:sugar phosphate isomerase/epimerase